MGTRDWGLTGEEAVEAIGLLVISFGRCFPRFGPRDQIESMLTNLIQRSPIFHALSTEQRAYLWERSRIVFDAAYREVEEHPDS